MKKITTLEWVTDWNWMDSKGMLRMDFKVRPVSMAGIKLKGNARGNVLILGLVKSMILFLRLFKIYFLHYTGLQL